jgi:hypothetical protein
MNAFEQIANDFQEVTSILEAFAQTFDEEYLVQFGSDFQADNMEETIYYTIAIVDEGAKSFRANFEKRFPVAKDFDIFTLSFLHELGHLETEWDMVDDIKQRNEIRGLKDSERYYNLHNEKIATDWAGEYLTDHYTTAKALENKCLKIIKQVWEKYPDE